jgi:hypothetical protein
VSRSKGSTETRFSPGTAGPCPEPTPSRTKERPGKENLELQNAFETSTLSLMCQVMSGSRGQAGHGSGISPYLSAARYPEDLRFRGRGDPGRGIVLGRSRPPFAHPGPTLFVPRSHSLLDQRSETGWLDIPWIPDPAPAPFQLAGRGIVLVQRFTQ